MYEDENGKRCIKMAPPVTRRKSPDHEFEMENPSRGTTKLKSVLYKYNKKVRFFFLLRLKRDYYSFDVE